MTLPAPANEATHRQFPFSSWGEAIAFLIWAVLFGIGLKVGTTGWPRLQLLPMIGALDNCLFAPSPHASVRPCGENPDSAARLIESTLQSLGPQLSRNGQYEVGYALNVPLLRMFQPDALGQWRVDTAAARRVAKTIDDLQRPVVLYFFSTHFAVGGELEAELSQDANNLARTQTGPLSKDKYYNLDIYPWSVARVDNTLTKFRMEAMQAVLNEVCKLNFTSRSRVAGVTVLGEVHQLFPGFESGMGFASDYRITDYSDVSRASFQAYLKKKFGNIDALNQVLTSDYLHFEEIRPPALDIRKDKLVRYHDHVDAYAAGVLPVSGWAHVEDGHQDANWVHVYVNGRAVARVPAKFGRQDVLAAVPELGTADVGWRHDIDFSRYAPGLYRIDVALERGKNPLTHLATRTVGVVDRNQSAPQPTPGFDSVLVLEPAKQNTKYWVDTPQDFLSLYFNPLVPLWHEFRAKQVTAYLNHVADPVKRSCLGKGPIYTHQIVPFVNPGWDASRFAIEDSLKPNSGLALGISLYGEPIYGSSALDWLHQRSHKKARGYGITEFHPLRPMGADRLGAALHLHRQAGARFVSFFAEPRWDGKRFEPGMNLFSLDPDNPKFGSDVLYNSFATLLKQP